MPSLVGLVDEAARRRQIWGLETEKCETACNSKDLGRLKSQLQESLQQTDTFGASTLLDERVKLGWLEGLRCAQP